MEEIAEMNIEEEEKRDPGHLFKQLMASINPFASYVLEECRTKSNSGSQKETDKKHWTLEESIF